MDGEKIVKSMNNKLKNLIFLLFLALILPTSVRAASLVFSTDKANYSTGDSFVVELKLNTENEKVNVIDAALSFDADKFEVKDISTGGSVFSLWTRTPVFSNESGKIFFTGGTPQNAENGKILTIVFIAKEPGVGAINILPDSAAYLADGKGTKETLPATAKSVAISPKSDASAFRDDWVKVLSSDKTAPKNPAVVLGQDPSLFDGKYFLSFSSYDEASGLNYFEVQEGGLPAVKTESPYVLRDQSLKSPVKISVFDKAGNNVTEVVEPGKLKAKSFGPYAAIIVLALLLLSLTVFIKYKKKNRVSV